MGVCCVLPVARFNEAGVRATMFACAIRRQASPSAARAVFDWYDNNTPSTQTYTGKDVRPLNAVVTAHCEAGQLLEAVNLIRAQVCGCGCVAFL